MRAMRPAIGVPLGVEPARGARRLSAERIYLDAVFESGGLALALPPQGDAEGVVARLDGLLLPGGGDFLPPEGRLRGVRFRAVPEERLASDRALLAAALRRGLPVLGVCYGMQLLVLAHGGRLLFDLPSERPHGGAHRLRGAARHALQVVADTRLARALGPGPHAVNSRHHQGVAEPGRGLRVAARAEDGLIEAVERVDRPFCLGVQWHPESLETQHRRALYGAFVDACAQGRRG
jgi:putative glutamine amidotransferase